MAWLLFKRYGSLLEKLSSCKRKSKKKEERKFITGVEVKDDKSSFHPTDLEDITRSNRHVPPAHYTIRVNSFSLLMEAMDINYLSNVFEVDSYKWRLSLFPSGNKKANGSGHISMYLEIVDTDAFPLGWEVLATFKFFVYDQIRDECLTIQAAGGRIRRFHGMRTDWGFARALPLDAFKNASNGYLVGDSCVFGVEVFVLKCSGKGESVGLSRKPALMNADKMYCWKFEKFSAMDELFYYSDMFSLMECNWKLKLYPRGESGRSKSISLFLEFNGCHHWQSDRPEQKLFLAYEILVKNQKDGEDVGKRFKLWFSDAVKDWGHQRFMLHDDLNDKSEGFLVNDTLIVEVRIENTAAIESFPKQAA